MDPMSNDYEALMGDARPRHEERMQLLTFRTWRKIWHFLRYTLTGSTASGFQTEGCGQIFMDVAAERGRQILKWGNQTHPCVPWEVPGMNADQARIDKFVAERLEHAARQDCENEFKRNEGTWVAIAREEMAEVIAAPNRAKRREEIVQTMAVLTAWLEDIDRKDYADATVREDENLKRTL
jgi:hypothetical protein